MKLLMVPQMDEDEILYAWIATGLLAATAKSSEEFSEFMDSTEGEEARSALMEHVREKLGTARLPGPNETFAIAVTKPKTAALCFDRVYASPIVMEKVPEHIGFYGATYGETYLWAQIKFQLEGFLGGPRQADEDAKQEKEQEHDIAEFMNTHIARMYSDAHDQSPTIVFPTTEDLDSELGRGSARSLALILDGLPVVDEERLEWDQVDEFRQDSEARVKYRRLMRWFDINTPKLTESQLIDEVAIRLDDYEWSIKKHGFELAAGCVTALMDPKFLSVASAMTAGTTVLAGGVSGLIVGTVTGIGKVVATVTTQAVDALDSRRSSNYEMAYVNELRKLSRK